MKIDFYSLFCFQSFKILLKRELNLKGVLTYLNNIPIFGINNTKCIRCSHNQTWLIIRKAKFVQTKSIDYLISDLTDKRFKKYCYIFVICISINFLYKYEQSLQKNFGRSLLWQKNITVRYNNSIYQGQGSKLINWRGR